MLQKIQETADFLKSKIKTNPKNIPGKGSAIFLHCSAERPTAGCIAIDAKFMKFLLDRIENDAIICIEI